MLTRLNTEEGHCRSENIYVYRKKGEKIARKRREKHLKFSINAQMALESLSNIKFGPSYNCYYVI